MALILAAVMAVSCLTTILLAASKPWTEIDLGSLSQYYETGTNADPGRISNVDGDSGGTSYGLYMFVEKTVTSFMDWLKKSDSAVYRGFGDRLYNAYAYNTSGQYYPGFGSNFKNTWQEIGRNNRTEFAQAQTDFWRDTQYTQLVANVEGQYKGFDIDNYSNALKNVFWSRPSRRGRHLWFHQKHRRHERRHRRHLPRLQGAGRFQEPERGGADRRHLRRVQQAGH